MTATTTDRTPLPLRHDTMLGVCQGLGEEFGFHPNWLRISLVFPFFFQPLLTSIAYLALGALLAFARWVAPDQVAAEVPAAIAAPADEAREEVDYKLAA